jgi:hypothetical protein
MTQQELEALLVRPLTSIEATNINLYLEIAKEQLEYLLCINLEVNPDTSGDPEETTRTFEIREGYSTVFTDIFTELSEVKVDGVITTDFYQAFWDKRNNSYYNSIVLNECGGKVAAITGYWDFSSIPADLQRLWAQAFAVVSAKRSVKAIESKKVEDFSVKYGDLSDDEQFVKDNARTIRKYSMCNIGYVKHGKTCSLHGRLDCGYCV